MLLARFPSMPATVLAERVGWTGSASWFRKRVALLRPEYAPKDPADRLSYRPGDQAQCDLWFPPARIPVGGGQACSPPVLVVVASFSRCITARMVPSRTTPDLLAGIWSLLAEQLGGGPAAAGLGQRGRHRPRRPPRRRRGRVHRDAGHQNRAAQAVRPRVERHRRARQRLSGDLVPARSSVRLPGRLQPPAAPVAADREPSHGPLVGRPPVDLLEADRAAMLPLPPVTPTLGTSQPGPAGPGLLRPGRRQRLLRRPDDDRPDGGDHRRTGGGDGHRRRPSRGPGTNGSGRPG